MSDSPPRDRRTEPPSVQAFGGPPQRTAHAGARDAIDAGARLAKSGSHGVHGQQNLAQAYLNQATNGTFGGGSPFG